MIDDLFADKVLERVVSDDGKAFFRYGMAVNLLFVIKKIPVLTKSACVNLPVVNENSSFYRCTVVEIVLTGFVPFGDTKTFSPSVHKGAPLF